MDIQLPSCSPVQLLISLGILFLYALFSFLETAVTTLRLFSLNEIANTTSGYKRLLVTLEKEPQRVLTSILIASSITSTAVSTIITSMTQDFLASFNVSGGVAFSAGIGVASIAIIVMGEIIPKNIAQAHGSHLFRYTLPLTNIIFYCMYPIVNILSKLSSLVINVIRSRASDTPASIASEKEIQFLIDYINKQGIIDSDKTQMLNSIFDLGNTTVEQIMVAEAD